MKEYMLCVFAVSALCGLLSLLVYKEGRDGASRFAFAVLLLYTVATPLAGLVSELSGALDFSIEDFSPEEYGEEYKKVAESAFCEGIERLLSDEFSLPSGAVDVHCIGFDFDKMQAEKIRVVLSPAAAFADERRIRNFINQYGMGECEVSFEV